MNQPNDPMPPNLPPSPPTPASSAPQKKSAKPWILGGCGCLTILLVIVVVCSIYGFRFLGLSNDLKRSWGNYDPYKGTVAALLQDDLSGGIMKFHLAAPPLDTTDEWRKDGATQALAFTYNQSAVGLVVTVQGVLVNFASAQEAQTALKRVASQKKVSTTSKTGGLRFSAKDRNMALVCWTNGSLLCLAGSTFDKPAENFEHAAPF